MSNTLTCTIPSTQVSYKIEIKSGILHDHAAIRKLLASHGSRFAIITDDTVGLIYGEALFQSFSNSGMEAHLFTFPSGEASKSRTTKETLEDQLFEKKLGRDTCVIAIGGGVVTDLGGYLAATYCRGVPLIIIPTSLLGMVDASIGGKTGVNIPSGKNLVGCIYQPKIIIIDPETLKSLPINELRNGAAEMIKHGLIADEHYFNTLEEGVQEILALNPTAVEAAIFESCRIKKEIVEQDEKESGKRRLVNFGHTVGHAIESLCHYSIAHGEAVAIGLLVESRMAVQLGLLPEQSLKRIHDILIKYGLPLMLPQQFSVDELYDAMILDKKSLKGRPRFVMISKIRTPVEYDGAFCTYVDETEVKKALVWMNTALMHT